MIDRFNCISCNSINVIKHGRTATGSPRLRCHDCGKTFSVKEDDIPRIEIWKIADFYLSGKSYRDLVKLYQSSPRRLNQKIRDYLSGFPNWEDYLDTYVNSHSSKVVFLTSKKFSCAYDCDGKNVKSLLMAIDLHSSLVLGYEITNEDNVEIWEKFLYRLKSRGIQPRYFLTCGSGILLKATEKIYPNSICKISFHKLYRDKELSCCLNRINVDDKVIKDSLNVYASFKNKNLLKVFELDGIDDLGIILNKNNGLFVERLKNRLQFRLEFKMDNMMVDLGQRLEKFHLLRENPEPIINALIARQMIVNNDNGFSRVSYYTQIPTEANISDFACGKMPKMMRLSVNSYKSIQFIIEVLVRSIELPIIKNQCEMQFHQCQFL